MKKIYLQPSICIDALDEESDILTASTTGDATSDYGGGSDGSEHHNGGGSGEGVGGTGSGTDPDDWSQGAKGFTWED